MGAAENENVGSFFVGLICGVSLGCLLFGLFNFFTNFEYINTYKFAIIGISVAIFGLIAGFIYSIKSIGLYEMYNADQNVVYYTLLADEDEKYKKMAQSWLMHSNWFLKLYRRNTHLIFYILVAVNIFFNM